jgi:hypothetical protein
LVRNWIPALPLRLVGKVPGAVDHLALANGRPSAHL